jgi:hypothetical protein
MRSLSFLALFAIIALAASFQANPSFRLKVPKDSPIVDGFRPPAVPLIVFDPFMSIWSMSDHLYDDFPRFWCGPVKALVGAIRVDGKTYRFMGPGGPGGIPVDDVITQKSVRVEPTQTYYIFQNDQVTLQVRFSTPTIPTDLDLLSQPVSYITFDVTSNDGRDHEIEIYYDQTAEIVVSDANEQVTWERPADGVLKMGTTAQNILGKSGDCDAINWGYAYVKVLPASSSDQVFTAFAGSNLARSGFVKDGTIPSKDDTRVPRAANDDWPVIAVSWKFTVKSGATESRYLTFAYDDIESVDFFGTKLPAYWRRNGQDAIGMLNNATRDYQQRIQQLTQYDTDLLNQLSAAAGPKYATIASLSFRQTFGGCKLVWNAQLNTPWYFMKEISSDGDIQTVDVIFPASPLFFYTNPLLMELTMIPLLAYANNETNIPYNLSWAPHHLGTYPICNLAPWQQEQMPVEETGNLLMIIAALVTYGKAQGKDYQSLMFPKYESIIKSWADYLISGTGVLPDPGDQLCTDDFLGPSPHNVNLALKGIVGLGCYARMCEVRGNPVDAAKYLGFATTYGAYWVKNANDGDHYRLQYDLANTWSLKYNMLYHYIVNAGVFAKDVMQTEIAYYMNHNMNQYGIPLNNQKAFTKLDWLSWIAAMAPNENDRLAIFEKICNFANETPSRVPLTDWYDTVKGTQSGFQARTVVGGVYAWMLLKPQSGVEKINF